VVELRYFAGLSVEETAEALGVHENTVVRDWKLAKAWLARELRRETFAVPEPSMKRNANVT
jgi:DNA-directed RNA polymerase specialized sigma24 family protein